jgi:ATP-dependent DNA helicase RecG
LTVSSSTRRPAAAPQPQSNPNDHVENALDALRREWKSGFNGRVLEQMALPSIRRLVGLAQTHRAASELREIEDRLANYRNLPIERRKEELVELAAKVKDVSPEIRLAPQTAPEMGRLRESVYRAPAPKSRPPAMGTTIRPLDPQSPVTALPRVGEAVAKKLSNLGVGRIVDLLNLSPRRHIDYSHVVKIGNILGFGEQQHEITVRGEVLELKEIPGKGPTRVTIRLGDDTGWVRVTWFNSYIARQIRTGMLITVSGVLDSDFGPPSFTGPEWEIVGGPSLSTGRLAPIYPLTAGLAQKTMRSLTRAALDSTAATLIDPLPAPIREGLALIELGSAYEHLHYPENRADLEDAQRRLAFDNLLLLQLGLTRKKEERSAAQGFAMAIDQDLLARFELQLPYQLTPAQRIALDEILADLRRAKPMARLLQGDVGSGKTAVAAAAALVAVSSGYQVAIMAPTEILAEQHLFNFRGLYNNLADGERPVVELLTGSTKVKGRRELLPRVQGGSIDILVGTHALIQEQVSFHRLGLSIIDEQHRFGVRQRSHLPDKAGEGQPHLLSMTATPIPRTLNLVLHGDLDVSIIGELPPGRIPVETRRFVGAQRSEAYHLVRQEVAKGHQVFVICPLVEESESSDMKAAVAEAERLQNEVFPSYRIAALHGRMSGKEKDRIMTAFRDREFDLLVSTSVIEVGIDVPNATVMLVEGAERFGLAQLHQFRGRVGRGGSRSYCLLVAEETSPDGEARLDLMVETNDGFVLAEKDLELRGPGEYLGTRQSGLPEMTWLDGSFDIKLLDLARQTAEELIASDPTLNMPTHRELRRLLEALWESAQAQLPS